MKKSNKFSPEVRERAVRMVQEHKGEYPSLWAAVESIAPKIGCVPQALLEQPKVGGRLFAFVGEAPVMKARLVTCEAEGRFRTEDIFETVVPMLKDAPQRDGFSF